ncbi:CDP-diacylglycerol--serine O-phosphatidyltransferase [Candidatus Woesearchaeota archaeon CG10_big_fil_rev_8_21_14_0_10_34_8]|nr:MAG: CDP-diacylglycerol--serine O-phosphatidyltransferase [Candidatus Woesearchaeota archaeon CG10_big_fil_rev_8_21_14_0_10_34_8]
MKIKDIIKTADFFTIGNIIFGLLSVFYAINNQFEYAAIFILIAMLFDFLDGKVARVSKKITPAGRHFGKELDSLADIISFGVAPAVLGFTLGLQQWYSIIVLLFFVIAGVLRLSRFNVLEIPGYFVGVPITINGILFAGLYFLSLYYQYDIKYNLVVYLFMSFAMLSARKVKKLI